MLRRAGAHRQVGGQCLRDREQGGGAAAFQFDLDFREGFLGAAGGDAATVEHEEDGSAARRRQAPGDAREGRLESRRQVRVEAVALEQVAHPGIVDDAEIEAAGIGLLPLRPGREATCSHTRAFHRLQPGAPLAARAQGDALAVQGEVGRVVIDVGQLARAKVFGLQQQRVAQEGALRRSRQGELEFDFLGHESCIIAHCYSRGARQAGDVGRPSGRLRRL
ncbi:MAG: hypothetical protein M5R42_08295 [Rhodocyclaceae bacterium]|nr:hypothetical protein [Rhodocyclaceae bacterium]